MDGSAVAARSRRTAQPPRPTLTISIITRSKVMTNESNPHQQPVSSEVSPPGGPGANHHESAPEHPAVSGRGAIVGVTLVLIAIVALAVHGILKRQHNDEVLADTTR